MLFSPCMKKKPLFNLESTGRFLVDTMRPRRRHDMLEGYPMRKSVAREAIVVVVALAAAAGAAAWLGLGR